MNKISIFIIIPILLSACKESLPPVDFGKPGTILLSHTAANISTSDLPDPEYRGILIEDLTGVRCVACPGAAKAAKSVKDAQANNEVVILGLYTEGPLSLATPHTGSEDMRTSSAQLIGTNIFDFSNQLPGGGVNRRIFDGEPDLNIPFATWANQAKKFENEESIVNISIEKGQKDDSTMIFNCTVIFTEEPSNPPFLTLLLLEDGIVAPQTYEGGVDSSYVHSHVVRDNITPYNGMPLKVTNGGDITKGSQVQVEWQVQIPSFINVSNASLAAFVNYNSAENKEVIQCTEIKLK